MTYDLERRRSEVERHAENTARLALAFARFTTTGIGAVEFEERVDFGLTFIEKPFLSIGYALDLDELAETLDIDEEDTPPIPIVSGLVTEWEQDERGFYTGAWVGAAVYFPPSTIPVPATASVECEVHYTFQAIAIKDVPVATDAAD